VSAHWQISPATSGEGSAGLAIRRRGNAPSEERKRQQFVPGTGTIAARAESSGGAGNLLNLGVNVWKLFVCQSCGTVICFENRRCGRRLAFLLERVMLSAIEPVGRR
jgi:hypothetical protein